ncbi:hypothetical protein [Brumimicrobium sp.]|uniref:hypothetical protein n=1 Tax=Brumimicrobium sp. TaxID=2029867 RepID=UPI003A928859
MSFIPITTPVSEIINKHTVNGVFVEDRLEQNVISPDVFQKAKEDVEQRLKVKVKFGKCSSVLVHQLTRHSLQIFEKFGNEIHHYHFPTMLDIIELVDQGHKMNVRPFNKNGTLAGLKHIHHNSNTFIAQNMVNCWKEKYGKNDEVSFQNRLLEEIFTGLLNDFPKEIAQKKSLTVLLTKILYESKFRKPQKQTGEWIVFAQKDNVNYYLCLATHNECKDFTDQVVYERIKPCLAEFPEIKNNFGGQI